jgi:hypothetical protein
VIVTGAFFAEQAGIDDHSRLDVAGGVWDWYGVGPRGEVALQLVALVQAQPDDVGASMVSLEVFDQKGDRLLGPIDKMYELPEDAENGFVLFGVQAELSYRGRAAFVISCGGGATTIPLHLR